MKLLTFSLLFLLTSCGTTIRLSTGKFKTYADADSLAVSDGTVSVTMVNVNHSRTNEVWAGAVKTLGSDTLRTVRHYLTMGAFTSGLHSLTGYGKSKLGSDATVEQAEISAGTRKAELDAANEAMRIKGAQAAAEQ
jgi:hypothetical protein